ncbi:hypothetical protein V8B97DRAFT_1955339 [Scleroderma yunnanense]
MDDTVITKSSLIYCGMYPSKPTGKLTATDPSRVKVYYDSLADCRFAAALSNALTRTGQTLFTKTTGVQEMVHSYRKIIPPKRNTRPCWPEGESTPSRRLRRVLGVDAITWSALHKSFFLDQPGLWGLLGSCKLWSPGLVVYQVNGETSVSRWVASCAHAPSSWTLTEVRTTRLC